MNVEQYKKRFYNLMESTIGDVKPILNEGTLEPPEVNITDKVLLAAIDGGAFDGRTFKKTQLNGIDAIFVASQKNPGQSIYYFGDYKKYRYNTLIPGPNEQPIETMTWTYRPR